MPFRTNHGNVVAKFVTRYGTVELEPGARKWVPNNNEPQYPDIDPRMEPGNLEGNAKYTELHLETEIL